MKRYASFNRAQSTLEYAIIVTVAVAALLAMQIYFKRGIQGKLKDSSDNIGSQYAAELTTDNSTVTTATTSTESTVPGAGSTSTVNTSSTTAKSESVSALTAENLFKE